MQVAGPSSRSTRTIRTRRLSGSSTGGAFAVVAATASAAASGCVGVVSSVLIITSRTIHVGDLHRQPQIGAMAGRITKNHIFKIARHLQPIVMHALAECH